ncbi:MAG: class I SAM-dependent methyltransferase [Bernardetiaceae bacterium]|jgi:2-polyprenyl-3-methyl-5-hydroxy-6-metoxy-1,4-benzoquinol methylase|nr:class I SAM-dependent methyltransferase [Bernardetiaceae bacterium]
MEKSYYQEYFELERKQWWFQVRNRILMERIAALTGGRRDLKILNVGAGTYATSQLLAQFGQVTSIEYDEFCVAYTKERLPGIQLDTGTILDLQFADGEFDLVTAFDVIEHVDDDALAVRELKRVCRPTGWVVVSVPAFMALWSHHDVVNHHFRRYTMPGLLRVFNAQPGGQVRYRNYFNSALFLPIAAFRMLSRLVPARWRRGSGADNALINLDSPVNRVLYAIFDLERRLLNRGWRFPFGVSAVVGWQK